MRRVVSVWFPHWPTDRLRRRLKRREGSPENITLDAPLVTAMHDGRRRVIAAVDQVAAGLSLRPGMAIAQALAILPGLQILEADPEEDRAALQRLARWCHCMTPLASADAPDGLWLDVTGCAHFFGNEQVLLGELMARLGRDGLYARAAVADTPGAAHAVARYAEQDGPVLVLTGTQGNAVADLPVGALRLPAELVMTLKRLGFDQVRHLSRIPRALLARRFGPLPGLRLDQVHGRAQETLVPLIPDQLLQRRRCFLEPLLTAEALRTAIEPLVEPLCAEMEHQGRGARQLDLLFERVDNQVAGIRIGTARPSRDVRHLVRLLVERLETVDPGLGIEAMRLVVPFAEPLRWEQQEGGATSHDVARLVDRLVNRMGAERVYRAVSLESTIPERRVCRKPADFVMPEDQLSDPDVNAPNVSASNVNITRPAQPMAVITARPNLSVIISCTTDRVVDRLAGTRSNHLHLVDTPDNLAEEPPLFPWRHLRKPQNKVKTFTSWPIRLRAPARLLDPPRPIAALAALPNQPPVTFTWQRRRYRVRRAEGPERIHGEWWWCRDQKSRSVRDYFQVEDERGQRFWLFRQGDGLDPCTGDLSWFLHGLF